MIYKSAKESQQDKLNEWVMWLPDQKNGVATGIASVQKRRHDGVIPRTDAWKFKISFDKHQIDTLTKLIKALNFGSRDVVINLAEIFGDRTSPLNLTNPKVMASLNSVLQDESLAINYPHFIP